LKKTTEIKTYKLNCKAKAKSGPFNNIANSFKNNVPVNKYINEIAKKLIIVAKELCIKYLYAASMPLFDFLFKPIKQYKHIFAISKNKNITNK
jgi:ribosomal protein S1